ncbi:hypothetical protein HK405_004554 [Cladochytrium tenue]|nr:hypothetical protein HK405_004554 [Cladochytrium tenue]
MDVDAPPPPAYETTAQPVVFIGFAPLGDLGWLAYVPVLPTIPYYEGRTAFVLIAWPAETVIYQIVPAQMIDPRSIKPFEREVLSQPVTSPDASLDDRILAWLAVHPTHELFDVGTTNKTPQQIKDFARTWRKGALKYRTFWDNNSSFADALAEFALTTPRFSPAAVVSSESVDANQQRMTPLAYAIWRKRNMGDSYGTAVNRLRTAGFGPADSPGYTVSVNDDGRVDVSIDAGSLATDFDEAQDNLSTSSGSDDEAVAASVARFSMLSTSDEIYRSVPHLNIVIQIVGSRGDVQPFVALGKELLRYGHRVRLATHATFRKFVTENGLEFFPLAGDPNELMAYMVKNPGLLPGLSSIAAGDIGKKRTMIEAILESAWRSCILPDPDVPGAPAFVADSIISNPVAFAHIHCAQRLFIPCHIFFTMPWNLATSRGLTNYLSYELVEILTWEGLGDIVNNFRRKILGLPKLSQTVAPLLLKNLHTIFKAVESAGVRAIVSKGWGGLGGEGLSVPNGIYMIGNCPHDWLFKQVAAVVHHGGAGTTAAGLRAGRPTVVVPFFGDQSFWGAMIASVRAGPAPIPFKKLTADRLAAAIRFCLNAEVVQAAGHVASTILSEDGAVLGAKSFHAHLPLDAIRCDLDPSRKAVGYVPDRDLKLSFEALEVLLREKKISPSQVVTYRYKRWDPDRGRSRPAADSTAAADSAAAAPAAPAINSGGSSDSLVTANSAPLPPATPVQQHPLIAPVTNNLRYVRHAAESFGTTVRKEAGLVLDSVLASTARPFNAAAAAVGVQRGDAAATAPEYTRRSFDVLSPQPQELTPGGPAAGLLQPPTSPILRHRRSRSRSPVPPVAPATPANPGGGGPARFSLRGTVDSLVYVVGSGVASVGNKISAVGERIVASANQQQPPPQLQLQQQPTRALMPPPPNYYADAAATTTTTTTTPPPPPGPPPPTLPLQSGSATVPRNRMRLRPHRVDSLPLPATSAVPSPSPALLLPLAAVSDPATEPLVVLEPDAVEGHIHGHHHHSGHLGDGTQMAPALLPPPAPVAPLSDSQIVDAFNRFAASAPAATPALSGEAAAASSSTL